MGKKIDVIIPVWNSGQYIEKFIKKMLSQTYPDFHMYFVYDDSDDATLQIIKGYQDKAPGKITILYSPQKRGQGAARDFAMDSGKIEGDYVIFLDADDYPERTFLEKLLGAAETYQADLVMCGFDCFEDKSGKIISVQMVNNTEEVITDIEHYTNIAYINPAVWNKLYRREVAEKVRFGGIKSMEDGLYIAKVLPYIKSIKMVNEVLYHYRVSDNSAQARITTGEFEERWGYYAEMSMFYGENGAVYGKYRKTFELIAFVKCAIGLTYRTAFMDMGHLFYYTSYSRGMLDRLVPGWRENKQLQMRHFMKRPMKANAVACCALLYRMDIFCLFVIVYWLYRKVSQREVRW